MFYIVDPIKKLTIIPRRRDFDTVPIHFLEKRSCSNKQQQYYKPHNN